jgi:nucleotide-binding universal stress UspA family protein
MKNCIVVPLDGSRFAEHALPYALAVSRKMGAPIHVTHVHAVRTPVYSSELGGVSDWEPSVQAWEEEYLHQVSDRLASRTTEPVKAVMLDGPTAESLAEYSQDMHAELVVLTTHGRGAFSRFWLGSTTDKLIRRSPAPLLVVHGAEESDPDLDREVQLSHCLLPLDGSAFAEQVLAPAQKLGGFFASDYSLLRVFEDPVAVGYPPPYPLDDLEAGPRENLRKEAQEYLDRIADAMRRDGERVDTTVAESVHPTSGVLNYVQGGAINWIALSTHGRKGLARFLLGSVADKVVRGTPVPVFVVHPVDS